MTSLADRDALEASTMHVAMVYLALGLDPERATFFAQSDVPQVTELCWVLNTLCPVSLMEKATSYKDKISKGLTANMGLFDYPVLQAADILIYDSELVPVGADQKQHIEITRDLAVKFNNTYGDELLKLPEPHIVEAVAVVPGIDGQKMSKSYDNTLEIIETPKRTKKRCGQIVTDSTPLEDPKDPEGCNVFALLRLFAEPAELEEIAASYRAGGYGYGHAKGRLAELINELFEPAREKYAELENDPDTVRDVLREGGRRAREIAERTLQRVREATGLVTTY
jgi:tryptophanyl-tRNA synthetase